MRVIKFIVILLLLVLIIAVVRFQLQHGEEPNSELASDNDNEYERALNFIKVNIDAHRTSYRKLVAPDGTFTPFLPYEYKDLYAAIDALDSLKSIHTLVLIEEDDQRKISERYIKDHTRKLLEIWRKSPFSAHVGFDDFLEYMLPYRAGKEVVADYHHPILELFSNVQDTLISLKTPGQAATLINTELKNRLVFDLRSHAELQEPDILTLLAQKKGSCESLTQSTALTMRMLGLAVAIDECPVWAHRNSGHQWNSFLDLNNHWIPFGGAEKNPDEFDAINDSVKAPKIFRHTFSVQQNFGPLLENEEDVPIVFRNKNKIDVTDEYVTTSDVILNIPDNGYSKEGYVYLAVFNAEEWKIVSWAKLKDRKALFHKMGNNYIVYLPVYYQRGKTIPASDPFILTPNGILNLRPDLSLLNTVKLEHFNQFYDIIWNVGSPDIGSKMELFYWKDKWVSCGVHEVKGDRSLNFKNVPEGALCWIKKHGELNTWQRIFTLKDGKQNWY